MDVKTFRKKVGHRIKVRRAELDITQRELGTTIGVAQAQISEWEIGRRMLKLEQAVDLARGLKISVDYLVGESENRAG
jgi:transcriptional regulator with XRE-family HTH domain